MKKILSSAISVLTLLPYSLYAASPAVTLAPPTPQGGATLQEFIDILITIVQWVATPMLVLCIIYAGYILVTAGGNETQITKAKVMIFWTLIGAAIVLGAHVIAGGVCSTAQIFDATISCV